MVALDVSSTDVRNRIRAGQSTDVLVPGALGIGFCNPSLVSLVSGAAGRHEQGRVQGAAGALESLGRALGPVWGNGVLQWFGEGAAYGSAALVLLGTAALTTRYHRTRVNAE